MGHSWALLLTHGPCLSVLELVLAKGPWMQVRPKLYFFGKKVSSVRFWHRLRQVIDPRVAHWVWRVRDGGWRGGLSRILNP